MGYIKTKDEAPTQTEVWRQGWELNASKSCSFHSSLCLHLGLSECTVVYIPTPFPKRKRKKNPPTSNTVCLLLTDYRRLLNLKSKSYTHFLLHLHLFRDLVVPEFDSDLSVTPSLFPNRRCWNTCHYCPPWKHTAHLNDPFKPICLHSSFTAALCCCECYW